MLQRKRTSPRACIKNDESLSLCYDAAVILRYKEIIPILLNEIAFD